MYFCVVFVLVGLVVFCLFVHLFGFGGDGEREK